MIIKALIVWVSVFPAIRIFIFSIIHSFSFLKSAEFMWMNSNWGGQEVLALPNLEVT